MTLESLRSLQTRIREATGADRPLDNHIARVFENEFYERGVWHKVPHYTTDPDGLGACVGLMREVLPGWRRDVEQSGDGKTFGVCLWQSKTGGRVVGSDCVEYDTLETHALLLAICAALIAEEEAKLTEKAG